MSYDEVKISHTTKRDSIISLVFGILSLFIAPYILGLIAVVVGVKVLRLSNRQVIQGKGMAIAGVVLGALGVILAIVARITLG